MTMPPKFKQQNSDRIPPLQAIDISYHLGIATYNFLNRQLI
jgi:hypothetical protein